MFLFFLWVVVRPPELQPGGDTIAENEKNIMIVVGTERIPNTLTTLRAIYGDLLYYAPLMQGIQLYGTWI